MENFYSAISLVRELYGIELDEDVFETYALTAWNKIGNKQMKLYKSKFCPIPDGDCGSYIPVPCNLDTIEAITLNFEDAQIMNSIHPHTHNQPIEQFIEGRKRFTNSLYLPGKLVSYRELGDKIYFKDLYPEVNILYKGVYTDEDGLPFINDKEKFAIATYCAYSEMFKRGLITKDQATIQLAQILKKDWLRACDQARIPYSISQNQMNEVLDIMSCWDRKIYNQSYKPIK